MALVHGSDMDGIRLLSRNLPTERSSHLNTNNYTPHREVEKNLDDKALVLLAPGTPPHDLAELVKVLEQEKEMWW